MAGGEPIPENPLIGTEDLIPTVTTQKQVPQSAQLEPTDTTTTEEAHQLENSTVLVIPLEDQDAIRNFWDMTGVMDEDAKTEVAVEITLPEPQESGASGEAPATPVVEPTAAETIAPEASLPTPPPEENAQSATPAETRGEEPQPEAESQTPAPETTQTPEATEPEQTPAPTPQVQQNRNKVPFRTSCDTCKASDSGCSATCCLACGDTFVLIFQDEADNEEARAKLTEEKRPDCNPGDDGSAYCKSCLLDWFDNSIAWPHRESLPRHEGESVLHLVEPFVSEAYLQRLKDIQAYWDDKDKIFCPVPTCSSYIPRATYTMIRETTITRTVFNPAPVKVEPATAPVTEEQNVETTADPAPETNTEATAATTETTETTVPVETTTEREERDTAAEPEATVEPAARTDSEPTAEPTAETNVEVTANTNVEATAETATEITVEPTTATAVEPTADAPVEVTTEATVETNAETTENATPPAAEPATEENKEEAAPKPEGETYTETIQREYKTQLAICSSPTCQTPVCTLCKSHFHGLDTPCASRTNFFKEFMLAKYTKKKEEKKEKETNENGEQNGEQNGEEDGTESVADDDSEIEYDEDGEYEEYPNRYRQCVNCQNLVARHTGCDHMTCACGAAFCFYCGGEYGQYHDCLTNMDYLAGKGVGGIKITNEEGFFDDEGAAVVVNRLRVVEKEEDTINVEKWLDAVEFTENGEPKKYWKVKAGVEVGGPVKTELVFTEAETVRLAKPMKDWKGKYY
ncbi:hypothetical protein TWF506_011182 [Arthrobotrys conoides]|uniref:IBR domain-containing protein n=1 Tax=Arthrobotrys conoides TaxID=74498 RepID=A0AAN8NA51_9PEZI